MGLFFRECIFAENFCRRFPWEGAGAFSAFPTFFLGRNCSPPPSPFTPNRRGPPGLPPAASPAAPPAVEVPRQPAGVPGPRPAHHLRRLRRRCAPPTRCDPPKRVFFTSQGSGPGFKWLIPPQPSISGVPPFSGLNWRKGTVVQRHIFALS